MSSDKKSKEYPRALPYRAPEEAVHPPEKQADCSDDACEQTAHSPTWACKRKYLLVSLLSLLILSAGGFGLWWWEARSLPEGEVSQAPQTDAPSSSLPMPSPASSKLSAEAALAQGKKDVDSSVVQAGKTSLDAPPVSKKVAVDSPTKERYLEALGSLTSAHLYQSYLNIGLLADAVESEQLDHSEAEKTLVNVMQLMSLVENQLDRIAKTDLDPDDQKSVQNIRKQAEFLQIQAIALKAYWDTGDADQATRFHEARQKAWPGISEILGLENMGPETPDASVDKTLR